ncbi:MAG: hypothetical protein M3552_06180 [Planctomycetota bacterium]|nr:hypothetical protein [Planctomycetota bacterium]
MTASDPLTWKVSLIVRPTSADEPVELSMNLQRDGTRIAETWSYLAAQAPPPYKYPQVYTRQD